MTDYGYVVARFVRSVPTVTGVPQAGTTEVPISGKGLVTFTPNQPTSVEAGTSPSPSTGVQQGSVTCDLDTNGYLSYGNAQGVYLFTGVWTVRFDTSLGWSNFQIQVTNTQTTTAPLDLLSVAPYTPPAGVTTQTILVPATVVDGDVLIKKGSQVDGVAQSTFTGPAGPANTLTIGTVSTLAPGAAATASITGTAPDQTLDLGLPQGITGPTGPANTLAIGTVTTVAAGGSATATITGTAPAQTLNLGLVTGQPSTYELRGTGSPVSVVTPASAGIFYTDTAGTRGAWRWISTGTTNTSWSVVYGDTGWRNLSTQVNTALWNAPANTTTDYCIINRVGSEVSLEFRLSVIASLVGTARQSGNIFANPQYLPGGFSIRTNYRVQGVGQVNALPTPMILDTQSSGNTPRILITTGGNWVANDYISGIIRYTTADAWPSTLPGTAA